MWIDRAVRAYVCPRPRHPRATPRRGKTTLQEKQRTGSFLKICPFNRGPTANGPAGEPEQLLPDLGEVAGTAFPIMQRLGRSLKNKNSLKFHSLVAAHSVTSLLTVGRGPPAGRRGCWWGEGIADCGHLSRPCPSLHFRKGLALASTRG